MTLRRVPETAQQRAIGAAAQRQHSRRRKKRRDEQPQRGFEFRRVEITEALQPAHRGPLTDDESAARMRCPIGGLR